MHICKYLKTPDYREMEKHLHFTKCCEKLTSTSLCVSQQKAKNEELIHLAEQRKKEVERKKTEAEEKERAALRRQYERERQARVDEVSSALL